MDSNTVVSKKRIRDPNIETDPATSPGANKKARKDLRPLNHNSNPTPSDSYQSLNNYVNSWLNDSLPQEPRLRRYSDSQVNSLDNSQQDATTSISPIRQSPKSLPDMSRRDSEDYAIPANAMTPVSVSSRGRPESVASDHSRGTSASSTGSRGQRFVERPMYRKQNLRTNNMHFEDLFASTNPHIDGLVDRMNRPRGSPEPTISQIREDRELRALREGAEQFKVADHFAKRIVGQKEDDLAFNNRLHINRQHVPVNPSESPEYKLSQPIPDALYGYSEDMFPNHISQITQMPTISANSQGLLLPFFAVQFKAQGPSSHGNLWVAENQAMGASVACVRIAEHLNRRLEECVNLREVQKIDTSAFSIAMNGTEARLFITWRETPEKDTMKHIESYVMSRPDHYLEFRRVVRNILDWGKDERLRDIFKCFDSLLEENRLQASKMAKDRPGPGSTSGSDVSRRRR